MSAEKLPVQPAFDPENPALSLDRLQADLPQYQTWLKGDFFGDTQSRSGSGGSELFTIRPYEPGDDVRYIDQAATARDPDSYPQVKHNHGDISPRLHVVTDILNPLHNVNTEQYYTKQNLGLTAVLAVMSLATRASIPYTLTASNGREVLSPSERAQTGRKSLLHMAEWLADKTIEARSNPKQLEGNVSFADLLKQTSSKKRSKVAIVSSFRGEAFVPGQDYSWEEPLGQLSGNRNDILAVEITDPRDFRLQPNASRFRNGQTNSVSFVSGRKAKAVAKAYAEVATPRQAAINDTLARNHAHHVKLSTKDGQYGDALGQGLRQRAKA